MTMILAERNFAIRSSRGRAWGCLTKALSRSVPLEQMNFLSERRVLGVLKVRINRFELPLRVDAEISEPEILAATIKATGVKGIVRLNQTARFPLADTNEGGTKVSERFPKGCRQSECPCS